VSFPTLQQEINDEGIPFQYVLTIFEDVMGNRPPTDPGLSAAYAEEVEIERELPVTTDLVGTLLESVPFEDTLPNKCIVTPELELLYCWSAVDNEEGFEAMRADFADR
jgi:hypothetical protein